MCKHPNMDICNYLQHFLLHFLMHISLAGRILQMCAGGKERGRNGTWTGSLDSEAPGKASAVCSFADLFAC